MGLDVRALADFATAVSKTPQTTGTAAGDENPFDCCCSRIRAHAPDEPFTDVARIQSSAAREVTIRGRGAHGRVGSATKLAQELRRAGHTTKSWATQDATSARAS
jgi:hypothetical protein